MAVMALAISSLAMGCGSVTASHDPQPLLGGLRSFQSPHEAQTTLGPALLPWEVVEDSRRDETAALLIVSIKGYRHLDGQGQLVLTFLNDRLMEARFHPEKLDEYLQQLQRANVQVSKTSTAAAGRISVFSGRDEMGGYVAWLDVRLQDEYVALIKRLS